MNEQTCSMCGGPLDYLGQLGMLEWFSCENCGMECSSPAEEDVPEDLDLVE